MKLFNCAQMRELDRYAIDVHGVPSTLLMVNAARHVAEAALELIIGSGCAAIFCGVGNNGGDGVAAATYLLKHGVTVRVFLIGEREKMTPDTTEMERRLNEFGGVLENYNETADMAYYLNHCDVIIDALFGIGLNTALHGDALEAVRLINASGVRVVSADIPSGIEADTGRILGEAVRADVTVTFTGAKLGHFTETGSTCCGELRVADIGIPPELYADMTTDYHAVVEGNISLPRRKKDTHKGDYGRALIIAGSVGYTGAPVLAAKAASVGGSGLVFLGVPSAIYAIAAVKCTEEIVFPLPDNNEGALAINAESTIQTHLSSCDVCLIGPGLGRSQEAFDVVRSVLRYASVPLIVDADGINAVSEHIDILDEAGCPLILTPHAGEFKRLGGDINGGRIKSAQDFAVRYKCILILKGHRTITALPDGTVYINTTGGPALAKGGSGDVLAGLITSFIGQKFPIKDAVLAAVYLHGLSGDMCGELYGEYSVTASDIIRMLPEAIKKVIT